MASETETSTSIDGASSSSLKFIPISFNNAISVRLDNKNFLLWRKQVLSAIRGHKLQHFVFGTRSPPKKFVEPDDERIGKINPEFANWEQEDQLLVSWLLSSMTEGEDDQL